MIRDAFGGTGTLEGGAFKPYADQAEADAATQPNPEKAEADGSTGAGNGSGGQNDAGTSQQADAMTGNAPLPEDFPSRTLLLEHGFDTLEKVKAGLEDGGVDKISGVGPATLKAIEDAAK